MSIRRKIPRNPKTEKDSAQVRKFLTIIAIATIVLMVLMYFAFVR